MTPTPPKLVLYYMRDNHTFRELKPGSEIDIIKEELNAGYTCGMLCAHLDKVPIGDHVHAPSRADGFAAFEKFLSDAARWIARVRDLAEKAASEKEQQRAFQELAKVMHAIPERYRKDGVTAYTAVERMSDHITVLLSDLAELKDVAEDMRVACNTALYEVGTGATPRSLQIIYTAASKAVIQHSESLDEMLRTRRISSEVKEAPLKEHGMRFVESDFAEVEKRWAANVVKKDKENEAMYQGTETGRWSITPEALNQKLRHRFVFGLVLGAYVGTAIALTVIFLCT